jgi:uncharacterized protein (TIGR02996 family)
VTATDTTFDALWRHVLAAPADDAPKLIAADYLDERGERPFLALGLRWCVANGRWPAIDRQYWWKYPYPDCSKHSVGRKMNDRLLRLDPEAWSSSDLATLIESTGRVVL